HSRRVSGPGAGRVPLSCWRISRHNGSPPPYQVWRVSADLFEALRTRDTNLTSRNFSSNEGCGEDRAVIHNGNLGIDVAGGDLFKSPCSRLGELHPNRPAGVGIKFAPCLRDGRSIEEDFAQDTEFARVVCIIGVRKHIYRLWPGCRRNQRNCSAAARSSVAVVPPWF